MASDCRASHIKRRTRSRDTSQETPRLVFGADFLKMCEMLPAFYGKCRPERTFPWRPESLVRLAHPARLSFPLPLSHPIKLPAAPWVPVPLAVLVTSHV